MSNAVLLQRDGRQTATATLEPADATACIRVRTNRAGGQAEREAQNAAGIHRVPSALKGAPSWHDRTGSIETVFEIAPSDGERSDEESALMHKLRGLLHVEDRSARLVRKCVAARSDAGE